LRIVTVVVGTKRRIGIDRQHRAAIAGLAAIGAARGRVVFDNDGSSDAVPPLCFLLRGRMGSMFGGPVNVFVGVA